MSNPGTVNKFLDDLRRLCQTKGICGIRTLGAFFMKMDKDLSKTITLEEFSGGMKAFGLALNDDELNEVFQMLDEDGDGCIEFGEFFKRLRPPLKECRKGVINEAFDEIDVNGDGVLEIADLKGTCYSERARQHPKYLLGEWSEDDVLRHFLDTFDTPGEGDGVVTRDEFINYYTDVSATVDDDSYFDMVMRRCWNLPSKSKSTTRMHDRLS